MCYLQPQLAAKTTINLWSKIRWKGIHNLSAHSGSYFISISLTSLYSIYSYRHHHKQRRKGFNLFDMFKFLRIQIHILYLLFLYCVVVCEFSRLEWKICEWSLRIRTKLLRICMVCELWIWQFTQNPLYFDYRSY